MTGSLGVVGVTGSVGTVGASGTTGVAGWTGCGTSSVKGIVLGGYPSGVSPMR